MAADNFLEFGNVNFGRDFKDKSKWFVKTSMENIIYKSILPEFDGVHESIADEEEYNLIGYGFYVGRDLYLGKGLSASLQIGGVAISSLDRTLGQAAKDVDLEISSLRTSHKVYQYEAAFAVNYLFDYRVVDVQPFAEFAAGHGTTETEVEYTRLGLTSETNGDEDYDVTVEEKFNYTKLSLGINFISYKGLMSYIKVTSLIILPSERETSGETKRFGETTINKIDDSEKDIDETLTVTAASFGIGGFF